MSPLQVFVTLTIAFLSISLCQLTESSSFDFFSFPTFERHDDGSSSGIALHARTRLTNGREGLLVDVGARDNLVGSEWVERVSEQLHDGATLSPLPHPIIVEGVGTGAQTCTTENK